MGDPPVADALRRLGEFAAGLRWGDVPPGVRDRLHLVLLDHLGVTAAGASTAEGRQLLVATDPPAGPSPIVGAGRATTPDVAAWLNGTAACSLELDEGNKFARGHPAAHVFPAVLAQAAADGVAGEELAAALLAGYEVAARAGAATRLHPGIHPHGNWGVLGAAAAVCRLRGGSPEQVAAAMDAGAGLVLATPFATALEGNLVRNAWVGHANVAGLHAATLAIGGLARVDRTPSHTLGGLLGELDVERLAEGLGDRWDVTRGYFKRHASCSYTHPPADAMLELRAAHAELDPARVEWIEVATHRLATPLAAVAVDTRLAAMFSIPYVVSTALLHGDCTPARFDEHHRRDPDVRRLASLVTVRPAADLDARLPAERAARVTVSVRDVGTLTAEVPNPVGDADHRPFGPAEVRQKLAELFDRAPHVPGRLQDAVESLAEAPDVGPLLRQLP